MGRAPPRGCSGERVRAQRGRCSRDRAGPAAEGLGSGIGNPGPQLPTRRGLEQGAGRGLAGTGPRFEGAVGGPGLGTAERAVEPGVP